MVATNPHRPAPPNPHRRDADAVITLNTPEAHLVRQWFDALQDLNPRYLSGWDHVLAQRLYQALGLRVPESVSRKTAVASPLISVQVDVQVGTDIGDAARCMLALAEQINCRVCANFNSISFFADPGESLAVVTDRAQCALSPKSSAG